MGSIIIYLLRCFIQWEEEAIYLHSALASYVEMKKRSLHIALCSCFWCSQNSIYKFLCKHLDLLFFISLLHSLIKLVHSDFLDFCLDVRLKLIMHKMQRCKCEVNISDVSNTEMFSFEIYLKGKGVFVVIGMKIIITTFFPLASF